MGKRRRSRGNASVSAGDDSAATQQNDQPDVKKMKQDTPKQQKADRWAAVEDGSAVSAAAIFSNGHAKENVAPKQQRRRRDRRTFVEVDNADRMPESSKKHKLKLHKTDAKKAADKLNGTTEPVAEALLNGAAKPTIKEFTVKGHQEIVIVEEVETKTLDGGAKTKRTIREEMTSVEGVDYIVQDPDDEAAEEELVELSDDASEGDEDGSDLAEFIRMDELGSDDEDDESDVSYVDGMESLSSASEVDEDEEAELGGDGDSIDLDEDQVHFLHDSPDEGDEQDEEEEDDDEDEEEDEEDEEEDEEDDQVGPTAQKQGKAKQLDFSAFPFQGPDSTVSSTKAFAWLIANCDVQTFFADFWQQNALVVRRGHAGYYGYLHDLAQFSDVMSKEHMEYGKNINVAEYRDGVRYTINGTGRVYPRHVQKHLADGHSVQLVNPQIFFPRVWYLCDQLQEIFGCFVGANTYMTPAGSSGFAPHWDDIDAFLMQLEAGSSGSSGNFSDKDMKGRQLCFEGWLEQGDMLYLPRGFIHQGSAAPDVHSAHITVSVGLNHSFADLLEKILKIGGFRDFRVRRRIPPGYLDMTLVAELVYRNKEQEKEKLAVPIVKMASSLDCRIRSSVHVAVDLMAREFMRTALPPMLTEEERRLSAVGAVDFLGGRKLKLNEKTRVRFIRRHAQRLIFESETSAFVVHRMSNSLEYGGRPEQQFAFDLELEEGFIQLQSAYPGWTTLGELSVPGEAPGPAACSSTRRPRPRHGRQQIKRRFFFVA
ncbi:unnamed protein product, partial [Mesorhabditis spiculigera]